MDKGRNLTSSQEELALLEDKFLESSETGCLGGSNVRVHDDERILGDRTRTRGNPTPDIRQSSIDPNDTGTEATGNSTLGDKDVHPRAEATSTAPCTHPKNPSTNSNTADDRSERTSKTGPQNDDRHRPGLQPDDTRSSSFTRSSAIPNLTESFRTVTISSPQQSFFTTEQVQSIIEALIKEQNACKLSTTTAFQ